VVHNDEASRHRLSCVEAYERSQATIGSAVSPKATARPRLVPLVGSSSLVPKLCSQNFLRSTSADPRLRQPAVSPVQATSRTPDAGAE
jgi:hypothetical protein